MGIEKKGLDAAMARFTAAMDQGDPAVFLPLLLVKTVEELAEDVKLNNVLIATQIRVSANLLHATAYMTDVLSRQLIEAAPECVPHLAVTAKQMEHLLKTTESATVAAGRLAANASTEETSHD